MGEQLINWLAERFGDEFRNKEFVPLLLSSSFSVLLVWSHKAGEYMSVLLSLMNLPPSSITAADHGVASLPIFAFVAAIAANVGGYFLLKTAAKYYLRLVCSIPSLSQQHEKMIADNRTLKLTQIEALISEHRIAELELTSRRKPVKSLLECYLWVGLLGLILMVCASFGNELDASIGVSLLLGALYFLHRSVGLFLASVSPWHARFEALTTQIASVSLRSL